jgi:hypothetical protein
MTDAFTFLPLGIYFFKESNKDGNWDIVLPHMYNKGFNQIMSTLVLEDIVSHSCVPSNVQDYFALTSYINNHCLVEMSGIGIDDLMKQSWVV